MSIVVTGATGALGGKVVDALRLRGVPAEEIVALGRRQDALAALSETGVRTAVADLSDVDRLHELSRGATAALLVSIPGSPHRADVQKGAIGAFVAAGVSRLVYTSWVHADTTTMVVARDHLATERELRAVDPTAVVLRCSSYFESRFALIPLWLRLGIVIGATGGAPISSATRADLAAAAAHVLVDEGHEASTYELASGTTYLLEELAALLGDRSGGGLPHADLDTAEFEHLLVDEGYSPDQARNLADHDRAIAAGELLVETGTLEAILGRHPLGLREALDDWVTTCRLSI